MSVPLQLAEVGLNSDPRAVLSRLQQHGDAPDVVAALAFTHVLACEFDVAAALAEELVDGPGASPIDRAIRGFVRSSCLAEPGEPPERPSAAAQVSTMVAFVEQEWAMSAGRVDLAEALARHSLSVAGTLEQRAWAGQALIRALSFQGRISEAVDVVREWPWDPLADPSAGGVAGTVLAGAAAFAAAHAGEAGRVLAHAAVLEVGPDPETYMTAGAMVLAGFALAALGEERRASTMISRAGGPHLRRLQRVDRVYGHEILLEDELAAGDLTAAARRVEQLSLVGIEAHHLAAAAAARCRARFAEATRDVDGAAAESAVAAERAEQVRGRLEVHRAALLAVAAQAGVDRRRAIDQFDAIADRAAETGLVSIRDWAVRELRRTGRRLRDVPFAGWESLTPRQALVARLAASGMRNREIAAQLFVSERTIDGHVRMILAVLGAPSRVDIGAHLPPELVVGSVVALTPRQRNVAGLVAEGRSNREIAFILGVTGKTVEKHLADLFLRLGVTSRSGVAAAIRMPLVDA